MHKGKSDFFVGIIRLQIILTYQFSHELCRLMYSGKANGTIVCVPWIEN
jgi:hypothetical protein